MSVHAEVRGSFDRLRQSLHRGPLLKDPRCGVCVGGRGSPAGCFPPCGVSPRGVWGLCCPSVSFVARSCYFPWTYLTLCLLATVHQTTLSCRVAPRAASAAAALRQAPPFHRSSVAAPTFRLRAARMVRLSSVATLADALAGGRASWGSSWEADGEMAASVAVVVATSSCCTPSWWGLTRRGKGAGPSARACPAAAAAAHQYPAGQWHAP